MTVDSRSFAWWTCLVGDLADDPPRYRGRSSRRFTYRTRGEALHHFETLIEGSDLELSRVLNPADVFGRRPYVRFELSFGSRKTYERRTRTANGEMNWSDA